MMKMKEMMETEAIHYSVYYILFFHYFFTFIFILLTSVLSTIFIMVNNSGIYHAAKNLCRCFRTRVYCSIHAYLEKHHSGPGKS